MKALIAQFIPNLINKMNLSSQSIHSTNSCLNALNLLLDFTERLMTIFSKQINKNTLEKKTDS